MAYEEAKKAIADSLEGRRKLSDLDNSGGIKVLISSALGEGYLEKAMNSMPKAPEFEPHFASVPGEKDIQNVTEMNQERYLKSLHEAQNNAVEKAKILLQNAADFKADFDQNSILKDIQNHYNSTSK